MRLYFHLVDQQEAIRDLEGVQVTDLEQARAEALQAVEELRMEDPTQDWSGWTLRISDETGRVLLSLDLDSSFQ